MTDENNQIKFFLYENWAPTNRGRTQLSEFSLSFLEYQRKMMKLGGINEARETESKKYKTSITTETLPTT